MATVRGVRLPLGAEIALAFAAGIAAFALVSVAVVADTATPVVLILIAACIAGVLAIFRFLGVAYAVPAALAAILAFDWFYVPPTHPHSFPDAESLANLLAALAVGVLVGELAAHAGRRADVSELARSELAEEQAALRRVATLVAEGVDAPTLFGAVAKEAGMLLDVDGAWIEFYAGEDVVTAAEWSRPGKDPPTFDRVKVDQAPVAAAVRRSGQVVRIDDFESIQPSTAFAEKPRVMSLVGAPITVESGQWGVMLAWSQDAPLPDDAEAHLTAFTELVATAIANTDARAEVRRLADEQAALRRVATLVARGVPSDELFVAVARELAELLECDSAHVLHYEEGHTAVKVVGGWAAEGGNLPVGLVAPLRGRSVSQMVLEKRRAVRIEDYDEASKEIRRIAREYGIHASIGAPITVDGRLWGTLVASSHRPEPLPPDTEARLGEFTALVATAISNTESRRETRRLADEQATLRRVATLVAEGLPPSEVFAAVARELGQLLGVDSTYLARYEADGTVAGVASWSTRGPTVPAGIRVPLEDTTVTGLVHETGRPARLDGYGQGSGEVAEIIKGLGIRSSAGAPITVDGQPWGVMIASSNRPEPLPEGTEVRIAAFTELVATAISNTEARTETRRLADEQAALRRVATLVAEDVPPNELFQAVVGEVGGVFGTDLATLLRYEDEETATLVSIWTSDGVELEGPRTWSMVGMGLTRTVAATDWPVRVDDWIDRSGPFAEYVRDVAGVTSSVGSPIVVEGRFWGALAIHTTQEEPVPAGTELRLSQFTELVATAISNAQARTQLADSRARILAAEDEERRRVVRDLHDGAQQRLVNTIVTLNLARSSLEEEHADAAGLVAEALKHAEEATAELRELAHGILPSVLTHGGLPAGVGALASRMPVPVETSVSVDRLPEDVEATAYFVVAEALTNVAKHARAENAIVVARIEDGELRVQVTDDGVGGANRDGSGLLGLADRLSVLDGTLSVESPAEGGTRVIAAIPVR